MRRAGLNNRFCLSVSQSVIKKILKSVICAQYTALKNIGIREKRIYFPSWAPVSSTWLFLGRGSASRSKKLAKFAPPTVIANYVQIRMECTDVFKITESMHRVALYGSQYGQYNVVVYLYRKKPSLSDRTRRGVRILRIL